MRGHGFPRCDHAPVQTHCMSRPITAALCCDAECSLAIIADDERLLRWTKLEEPIIAAPPPGLQVPQREAPLHLCDCVHASAHGRSRCAQVMGFRDPYVIETGGSGRKWRIMLGSGIAGAGGSLLVYSSPELTSGVERCMNADITLHIISETLAQP